METQLTIKHLAAYLPYGLKAVNEIRNFTVEIKGLQTDNDVIHNLGKSPIKFIKPILRPLSDLTKEIEVNGEKFISAISLARFVDNGHNHADSLIKNYGTNHIRVYTDKCDDVESVDFKIIVNDFFILKCNESIQCPTYLRIYNKLLEWHFNVFNLPENLFVDINTLEK